MAVIGDGKPTFLWIVDELSEKGIRLTQVPSSFNETAETYPDLILSLFSNLRITLHSRWLEMTNGGMYKTIGFQLDSTSIEWLECINGLQNKSGALPFQRSCSSSYR
jgi:hypothetical protein